MAFNDEIQKVSSQRFVLARLEPARFINDDLSNPSSNIYTVTLDGFTVSKVQRSGTDLTKVTDTPNSNGEWNFDETTGLLTIYSTSAPDTTNNVFVVFYYLFYATDYDRVYPQDVTSGVTRNWCGRITSSPTANQSIANVIKQGQLTSSQSPLSIANADFDMQRYLTANDSFYNKACVYWVIVNGEIMRSFSAVITSISIQQDSVTFSLNDKFALILSEPPSYGDSVDETYVTPASYPNAPAQSLNRFIPLQLSQTGQHEKAYQSCFTTKNEGIITDDVNYDEVVLCRIPKVASLKTYTPAWNVGAVTYTWRRVYDEFGATIGAISVGRLTAPLNKLLQPGDHFTVTISGTPYDAISLTGGGDMWLPNATFNGAGFPIPTSVSGISQNPGLIVEVNGAKYIACPNVHFTTSVTTQSQTKLVEVSVSNISTMLDVRQALDATVSTQSNARYTSDMIYRYRVTTDGLGLNHSDVLKQLFDGENIDTDASTFTSAKNALSANLCMQIPKAGETSPIGLVDYAQDIVNSTVGVIYQNDIGEIEYQLTAAPSAGDVIDENITISELSTSLEYRDISTKYILTNDNRDVQTFNPTPFADTEEIIEEKKAQYLHETQNTVTIKHVLEDKDAGGRLDLAINMRKNRFVNYKYKTSSSDLSTNLFDNKTITNGIVAGGSGSVNTKVIEINKGHEETEITVSDLLGL